VRALEVDVRVDGDLEYLEPAAVRLAHHVLQEVLTNVVRHAAPTTAWVRLERDGEELRVSIADAGRRAGSHATAVSGSGTGLQGLAERLAVHGGTLVHGPAGDGYTVQARIPLRHAVLA
jgi:signal transduction histidine kinase